MGFLSDLFAPLLGRKASVPTHPARCPGCNLELAVCLVDDFAVSRCGNCYGLFCPPDVFDKLLNKADADLAEVRDIPDTHTTFAASVSARGCPACDQPMHNYLFRDQVWLDSCPHGHGLWFDRGELAMVHQVRQAASRLTDAEKAAMGKAFAASTDALVRGAEELRRFNEAQAAAREEAHRYSQSYGSDGY